MTLPPTHTHSVGVRGVLGYAAIQTCMYVYCTPRGAMSSADRVVGALTGMQKQLEQYTERVKSDKVSDHLSPRTERERAKKTYIYVCYV